MESFFSPLKTERTARKVYRTRAEVGVNVFDCAERLYNSTRRHSMPGYLNPIELQKTKDGVRQTSSSSARRFPASQTRSELYTNTLTDFQI